jgi:serine/threonine protein kinase
LIKDEDAREVLKIMLEKDPTKRAKLEELIDSKWVSNKNTEKLEIDKVEVSDSLGLGNVNRILKISNLRKSSSHSALYLNSNIPLKESISDR